MPDLIKMQILDLFITDGYGRSIDKTKKLGKSIEISSLPC
jgi:hypothetical protein